FLVLFRRAPPRRCHYEPLPVRVRSNLIQFVPQETLIGVELPAENTSEAEPTRTYELLLDHLDRLSEREQDRTTPAPIRTTRSPQSPKRKGRGRKGKGRSRSLSELHNGVVRLVRDEFLHGDRGRVEIYVHGEWGTVCDDLWSIKNAEVVCRQLGFKYALKAARNAEFGEGKGLRILLDDVHCNGTEFNLLNCIHAGVGNHNCAHYEDAGVICGNSKPSEEA
ncbi:HHIP-like protein 1, partial [Poecilia latipinna]|uniref:HHIP-like protein 1 n=1 Tax=Poecilia latipinna TaxID=48699 RepID=UPI00072E1A0F